MIEGQAFPEIETERLILRRWRDADRAPWAAMNADPLVREFFPNVLSLEQSNASIASYIERGRRDGFTYWAVEEKATGAFAGFTGLTRVDFDAHFTPAVEAGWRFARPFWGRGYAIEAAQAAFDFGFGRLGLAEIVAFTAPGNVRSRLVMQRLGMTHDPAEDFIHPKMPRDHPLQPCVLYRLGAARWARLNDPTSKEETTR